MFRGAAKDGSHYFIDPLRMSIKKIHINISLSFSARCLKPFYLSCLSLTQLYDNLKIEA